MIGELAYPLAVLVITTSISLTFSNSLPRIVSFSAVVQPIPHVAQKSHVAEKEQDVMLVCNTERSSSIQINKLPDEIPLIVSQEREQSLTYLVNSVTCEDVGTYECIADNVKRQTTDIVVSDCNPRPCRGDDINKSIYIQAQARVQFFLCVMAYPGISPFMSFNDSSVRKKEPSNWVWDYQESQGYNGSLRLFNISILHDEMTSENYGILNIRVYSSSGLQYYLNYTISLQTPEEIASTEAGLQDVSLSKKPTLDGGSTQQTLAYSSKDNMTWYPHNVTEQEHQSQEMIFLNLQAVVGAIVGTLAGCLSAITVVALICYQFKRKGPVYENTEKEPSKDDPLYEEIIDFPPSSPGIYRKTVDKDCLYVYAGDTDYQNTVSSFV